MSHLHRVYYSCKIFADHAAAIWKGFAKFLTSVTIYNAMKQQQPQIFTIAKSVQYAPH